MAKKQKDPFRVSAKNLGALNMPDACPRCFWIGQRCKPLPFQIFPGIFSSIDAYSKTIVHGAFDLFGHAPSWLPGFEHVYRYLPVPHWSKFVRTDQETGITVSGVVDGLFENIDGTFTIPDYKTAKFTDTQDELYPMYVGQLNSYAWIQNGLSAKPVSDLWLIYFEPITKRPPDDKSSEMVSITSKWPANQFTASGFNLRFDVHTIKVDVDIALVDKLLAKAKIILELTEPPAGLTGCKDCDNLSHLHDMLGMF